VSLPCPGRGRRVPRDHLCSLRPPQMLLSSPHKQVPPDTRGLSARGGQAHSLVGCSPCRLSLLVDRCTYDPARSRPVLRRPEAAAGRWRGVLSGARCCARPVEGRGVAAKATAKLAVTAPTCCAWGPCFGFLAPSCPVPYKHCCSLFHPPSSREVRPLGGSALRRLQALLVQPCHLPVCGYAYHYPVWI